MCVLVYIQNVCVLVYIQKVCVLGEFDLLASAVAQTRTFKYSHGGVVGTHDVLGERHGKY